MADLDRAIAAAREALARDDLRAKPATAIRCVEALRDLLAALDAEQAPPAAAVPANIRERWNIERDGDALRVCFNNHEKGEACEYVRYVPEAPPAAAVAWVHTWEYPGAHSLVESLSRKPAHEFLRDTVPKPSSIVNTMPLYAAPPAAAVSAEPIGWVFQHEDTGRMTFCANDGINTPEVFQRLNPRHVLCGAAYTKAPPAAVFKSTAKRVAALQALDAAQAPPAAAVSERDESPVYVCEGLTVPAWAVHYANELGAYFKASGTGFWAIGPVQSRYGEAPPAAAVFKITASDHTGTHDYEAWAGLQAPPAAADELSIAAHGKRMYDRGFADGQKDARIRMGVVLATQAPPAAAVPAPAPSVEDARRMGEQGGPSVESERLAFEAWMRGHCWALGAVWNGKGYIGMNEEDGFVCPQATRTRGLWAAWRDRAALQAPPAAADCPMVKKWNARADELAACQTAEAIDRVLAERAQGVKP